MNCEGTARAAASGGRGLNLWQDKRGDDQLLCIGQDVFDLQLQRLARGGSVDAREPPVVCGCPVQRLACFLLRLA